MRTNARWLSLVLFFSFSIPLVALQPTTAWAKHHHDDDDDWWKHHDRDEWKEHHYKHNDDDARCGQILDRMRFDRSKIREIEPTGRHRKALQWYRDDLGNAGHDLDNCRHGG
jgi:hypothetical protein